MREEHTMGVGRRRELERSEVVGVGRARPGSVSYPHDLEPGMVSERVAEGIAGRGTSKTHRGSGRCAAAAQLGSDFLAGSAGLRGLRGVNNSTGGAVVKIYA